MFSSLVSIAFVVLHTGHSVTFGEYLFRALVYLVAIAGLGVTVFYGVRAVEVVRSELSRRGGLDENEP
jgi:hypothetical protein